MTLTVEIGAVAGICMLSGGILMGTNAGRACLFGTREQSHFKEKVADTIRAMNNEDAERRDAVIEELRATLDANIKTLEEFSTNEHAVMKHSDGSAGTKTAELFRREMAKARELHQSFCDMRAALDRDQAYISERIDEIQQHCDWLFGELEGLYDEKETWRRAAVRHQQISGAFSTPKASRCWASLWGKSHARSPLARLDAWLTDREQTNFMQQVTNGVG